jgi:inward rectifier potassium channel
MYVTCLRWTYLQLCCLYAACALAQTVLFFVVYLGLAYTLGKDTFSGWDESSMSMFMYSLAATTESGASPIAAVAHSAGLVRNAHAIITQMVVLFFTGVFFTKLAEPADSIRLSQPIVIGEHKGQRALMVRLAITRDPPELVDARFSIMFKHSKDGFIALDELDLKRSQMAHLRFALYIIHIITPLSPLHDLSHQELIEQAATFRCTVIATELTSMETVCKTREYSPPDICYDCQFEDLVYTDTNGDRVLDHDRLDMVKEKSTANHKPALDDAAAAAATTTSESSVDSKETDVDADYKS